MSTTQVHEELKSLEAVEEDDRNQEQSLAATMTKLMDRTVLRPMALLVFLFFTQSFSGSNMVSYYTVTILQMANIPLDENLAAILVAAQYVVGYSLSSMFVTKISRRALLFGSLALMMMANLGAGIVLFNSKTPAESELSNQTEHMTIIDADQLVGLTDLEQDALPLPAPGVLDQVLSMVPVISCILITFGYACGLGPVPFILFGELFPSSVRGSATSITAFLRSITVFLSIKIFPSLLWLCDIWGSFLSCALVCGVAIGVSFLFVPETKGMDSKQLENIYKRKQNEPEEAAQSLMLGEPLNSA
jgi:MFS family permease